MDTLAPECPAVHVTFTALADEGLFPWVRVGAEEEGVPCRPVTLREPVDVVALAYTAAENSRLNIGLAIDRSEVVLHEVHMPARQPVLRFRFDGRAPAVCRLMGGNAARLVMRLPFRFPGEEGVFGQSADAPGNPPQANAPSKATVAPEVRPSIPTGLDPRTVAQIVATVVRKLEERGIE